MPNTLRRLTIGALAKATGVTTPTIRYYEDIGLLPPAGRTQAGQRSYDQTDVNRLTFIRRCRDFGFSIEQVRMLAGLAISQDSDCNDVRDVTKEHLRQVRVRMMELVELERSLAGFVESCNAACAGGPGADCTIFNGIGGSGVNGCC